MNTNVEMLEPLSHFSQLAPRPKRLADTGLGEAFAADLVGKHLLDGGILTLSQMSDRLALSGSILEAVLAFMRKEARVEVLAGTDEQGSLRYALTDRGRHLALDAMHRSGYVGPAPIPLAEYKRIVQAQTVHGAGFTREEVAQTFADVTLLPGLLDQLGPAMNSGRAIFIYGPAGTGKTYVTQRLSRLFREDVLIPHAILVNDAVLPIFDPILHKTLDEGADERSVALESGFDPRYVRALRPVVITGGELTADMLDVSYDTASKLYRAPMQLKAMNGMFIIDDMGRQKVSPEAVFNRWIVPLEEKKDYLSVGAGRHFSVPFDTVLVFSTNMHPLDLADEAFLRRIGYKIEFETLTPKEYHAIWREVCELTNVSCPDEVVDHVIGQLHGPNNVPLLPCHPRDLLGIALDYMTYIGEKGSVTNEHINWAWRNYFVSMDTTPDHSAT